MSNPPIDASLLFGLLAESGHLKRRKNGSYRMQLKEVGSVNWFTDRPERLAGTWSSNKFVKKWNTIFELDEPNAQATFFIRKKANGLNSNQKKIISFEMIKPKFSGVGNFLEFNIVGIGSKNDKLLSELEKKQLVDISVFIDNSSDIPSCYPNCRGKDLSHSDLIGAKLSNSIFIDADLNNSSMIGANLTDSILAGANLDNADLTGANFTSTSLADTSMLSATMNGLSMSGAFLNNANLSDANIKAATLENSNMYKTNLTGALLNSTNLTNANLTNAVLDSANLTDVHLFGADLSGASLKNSTLSSETLSDAIWGNTTCPDGSMNSGSTPCTATQLEVT